MPEGMPLAGMPGAGARLSPRALAALLSGLAAALLLGLGMLAVHVAGDAGQAGLLLRWSAPVVAAPVLVNAACNEASTINDGTMLYAIMEPMAITQHTASRIG